MDNLVPDSNGDYSSAVSDIVTNTHGLVARGAWVGVGRDLFYVSTRGVTSLQLTEENRVKGVDLPLSTPMSATWARINWNLRDKIRIGYWDNNLYVALPLDAARVVDTSANLATGSYVLFAGIYYRIVLTGLQPNGWYYYEAGANDLYVIGQNSVYTSGFVQASALGVLLLYGTSAVACTATLNSVPFYNCNTAVAVYDFQTGAWAGVDETPYVTHVKEFLTATIQGKQRLVAVTEDGLLRLWEEGFEDERLTTIASPYVDITVQSQPTGADTLQLNNASGSLIDVDSGATTNFGDTGAPASPAARSPRPAPISTPATRATGPSPAAPSPSRTGASAGLPPRARSRPSTSTAWRFTTRARSTGPTWTSSPARKSPRKASAPASPPAPTPCRTWMANASNRWACAS